MSAWGIGLLVFTFLPFVSGILAGTTMLIMGRMQRTKGPLAAENGRRAANWGLTYLLASVLLVGAHIAVLFAVQYSTTFFPVGIPLTIWGVITVAHIIATIVGLVMANGNKVVKWNGIPFFRS